MPPLSLHMKLPEIQLPPIESILDYELHSSRWAKYIKIPFLQSWTAKYYAWKARRKYHRASESARCRAALNRLYA